MTRHDLLEPVSKRPLRGPSGRPIVVANPVRKTQGDGAQKGRCCGDVCFFGGFVVVVVVVAVAVAVAVGVVVVVVVLRRRRSGVLQRFFDACSFC